MPIKRCKFHIIRLDAASMKLRLLDCFLIFTLKKVNQLTLLASNLLYIEDLCLTFSIKYYTQITILIFIGIFFITNYKSLKKCKDDTSHLNGRVEDSYNQIGSLGLCSAVPVELPGVTFNTILVEKGFQIIIIFLKTIYNDILILIRCR